MATAAPRIGRLTRWLAASLLLVSLLVLCLAPAGAGVRVERLSARPGDLAAAGQALVQVAPGTSTAALQAALANQGCAVLRHYRLGGGTVALVSLPEGKSVLQGVALLQGVGGIRQAEPNRLAQLLQAGPTLGRVVRAQGATARPLRTPNDPRYGQQYQWPLCNFPTAWDRQTGSPGIIAAVIDTGVDYTHEDLAARMWVNPADGSSGYDFGDDDNDPMDVDGHGTHVAGLIGAATDNALGVAGADWACRIMALKVMDDAGVMTFANIIAALQFAVDNGASVVNMSLGSIGPGSFVPAITQPITDAFNRGVTVVAAAGNDAVTFTDDPSTWRSPVCNDGDLEGDNHVLGVAACDQNKVLANFFMRDGSSQRFVDLVAPGVAILSTVPGDGYQRMQGTSMASPIAAGAACIYRAEFPLHTPQQVIDTLRAAGENIDAQNPGTVGQMGQGLLNISGALRDIPPAAARNPKAFDTPGDDGGSITITWTASTDDGSGFNDVARYDVMKASAEAGPFSLAVSVPATGRSSYSAVHTPVVDGDQYWYRIDTYDEAGGVTPSVVVGPASAKDDLAPPQVTTLVVTDTPGDLGGSLDLNWTGYVPSADLAKFNIYRATGSFSDISGMTPLATLMGSTARRYIDEEVQRGTRYWYAVTGVDKSGNENPSVVAVGPAEPFPDLGISFPAGLSLIALPLVPTNTDMGAILGIGGPGSVRLAAYNPSTGQYVDYAEDPGNPLLQQALGRGFWIRTSSPLALELSGRSAPAGDYVAPLAVGWNLLGNPYSTDLQFGLSEIVFGGTRRDLATSNANGHTDSYGWTYDNSAASYRLVSNALPFASRTVARARGFFFRSQVAGSFVFKRPVGALQVAEEVPAAPPTEDNWTLRLVARSAGAADTDNFVGVSPQAAALSGIAGPPPVAGGVELSFPVGGVAAASSFVAPGQSASWDLQVAAAQAGAEVALSWPDLSSLPHSVRPVLTDLATGRSLYLRTVPTYRFRAGSEPRQFRLTLAGEGSVMLTSVTAEGGTGRAALTYVLSAPAQVTVEVLSISGRLVRTVTAGSVAPAGLSTAVWDGRNASGSAAPAGVYLVRVTAESDSGQRSSVVRTMSLQR